MVDFGAHFGDFGVHFGDFGAHFGDFGVHFGDFGAYFGGLGCPIGAQRLEQGPLARCGRCKVGASNSVLGPLMLYETSRRSMGKGQMPYAIGPRPYAMGSKPNATKH